MTDRLERWLARERRFWSSLVQTDDGTSNIFEDLARRSEPHVVRMPWSPHWLAWSAYNPDKAFDFGLPMQLVDEWEDYARRWDAFLVVNPRIRLATMLIDISESRDGSSWPYGHEKSIRDWIISGFVGEAPLSHAWQLEDTDWRRSLFYAARDAGDGFVYHHEDRLVWKEVR